MRAVLLTMALFASPVPQLASAHGLHDHGIDEISAAEIVVDIVRKLTANDLGFDVGQLHKSWDSVTTEEVAVIEADGHFYTMRVKNQESHDDIYILMGVDGQILEVDSTNNF